MTHCTKFWRVRFAHAIIANRYATPSPPQQHGSLSRGRPPWHGQGGGDRAWPVDARAVAPHPDARTCRGTPAVQPPSSRSEEHTSELQSLMRISYAVFCLKKQKPLQSVTQHTI